MFNDLTDKKSWNVVENSCILINNDYVLIHVI